MDAHADRGAGCLTGWPDAFAGGLVGAVRYLAAEITACESQEMERMEAESRARRDGREG